MHMIIKKRKMSIFIAKSLHCPIFNQKYPLERIKKSFISEKVSSKWKEDIRGRNFTEISYWEQLAVWNRYYVDEWSAKEKERICWPVPEIN